MAPSFSRPLLSAHSHLFPKAALVPCQNGAPGGPVSRGCTRLRPRLRHDQGTTKTDQPWQGLLSTHRPSPLGSRLHGSLDPTPGGGRSSSHPQRGKPMWRYRGVVLRHRRRLVAEECVDQPHVLALVYQAVSGAVAQHVRMHIRQPASLAGGLDRVEFCSGPVVTHMTHVTHSPYTCPTGLCTACNDPLPRELGK